MSRCKELCCLLMVCLLTVVDGTTLPITETPTPPWTTTTPPPACIGSGGTYHRVGEWFFADPCTMCECTQQGPECRSATCPPCGHPMRMEDGCCPRCEETTTPPTTTIPPCYLATCGPTMCSDAVRIPGDCCPTCPNGPDCRDPDTGEMSSPGSYYVSVRGMECVCPEYDNSGYGYREPMCQIETTAPPPRGCFYEDQMYPPGKDFQPGPCMYCYCDELSMEAFCAQPSCMMPMCPNPVSGGGACCPTCPNGPACMGMNGDEIPDGQTKTYPDGTQCTCQLTDSYNGYDSSNLMAICAAPKPKVCVWQDKEYQEGQFQPDPCTYCECVEGQVQCMIADCAVPPCTNPQHKPDQCCPVCPNGPDCMGRDETTIPAGTTMTYEDGEVCSCSANPGEMSFQHSMPVCFKPTPPPPTTTPPPPTTTRRPRRTTKARRNRRLRRKGRLQKAAEKLNRQRREASEFLRKLLAKY